MLGPIFVREWLTAPRRPQHYAARAIHLGMLWVLGVTAWQALIGWSRPFSIGDTARFGQLLFRTSVYFQLVLLLFFAALTAAAAVAQEKDRRTFILLLLTDLRSYEIVLGKLLGALLPTGMVVLGSAGVFALGLLLGGVDWRQIVECLLVLLAAGVAAGSLGCLVALWRDQTFPALALTVLLLVLYFAAVQAIGLVDGPPLLGVWLDPFQCVQAVLDQANPVRDLTPVFGFLAAMTAVCVLLNGWSMLRLRVWNPSGEPIMRREPADEQHERAAAVAHAAPGRVRAVWSNPVLWREIRTRAYGQRPLLVKAAYALVISIIAYHALAPLFAGQRAPFAAAWGLLPAVILTLLLMSAQAVTAVTSERDKGALDLLLVTDLSPREFIFGKLLGVAYNTKEFLLPPLALIAAYAAFGWLATPPRGHAELAAQRNLLAAACSSAALLLLAGFVVVLGVHIGLRTEQSRLAITHTLGAVFFLSVGTLVCIWLIVVSGRFEVQWTSFVLFLAAGMAGLWWVLSGERPSLALNVASIVCPLAVLYAVMNVLVGKPGSIESSNPLLPTAVLGAAFGFAIAAMLVPLLSEFDVALGRTTGND